MLVTLFVYQNSFPFSDLSSRLRKHGEIEMIHTNSMQRAIQCVSESPIDLVIIDEIFDAKNFYSHLKELVQANPFFQCAIVSTLSSQEFHDITEGLGILMQLPPSPGIQEADQLIEKLQQISLLMKQEIQEEERL